MLVGFRVRFFEPGSARDLRTEPNIPHLHIHVVRRLSSAGTEFIKTKTSQSQSMHIMHIRGDQNQSNRDSGFSMFTDQANLVE